MRWLLAYTHLLNSCLTARRHILSGSISDPFFIGADLELDLDHVIFKVCWWAAVTMIDNMTVKPLLGLEPNVFDLARTQGSPQLPTSNHSGLFSPILSSPRGPAMPWPDLWSSKKKDETAKDKPLTKQAEETIDSLLGSTSLPSPSSPWSAYTQPQTVVGTLILTTVLLGSYRFYKSYLRRIPEAINIRPGFFRTRSVFGKVTSVGDGDNFRLYHTPGGLLTGWHWLPWRRVPTDKKDLKNKTVGQGRAPDMSHGV